MSGAERSFPHWTESWGTLVLANARVRSQCRGCGIQHRVDPLIKALRFGTASSPVDKCAPCTVVGCEGTIFYLASPAGGDAWITLLSSGDEREAKMQAVPPLGVLNPAG